MMQAAGSAAKEIPLQWECQPAPEEPTSGPLYAAGRLSRQMDPSELTAAGAAQALFSFPALASVRRKDQNCV